ncbi:MAG: CpXC domain-containing protein, partial [Neomegalonema sp.]|nr:CpXC domain-containing protein [Neomegalonema sp.]
MADEFANGVRMRRGEAVCAECGAAFEAEVAEIVDLAARPELAEGLRSGAHWAATCPNGHRQKIHAAVLILPKDEKGIIFLPAEATSQEEDQAWLQSAAQAIPRERMATQRDANGDLAPLSPPRFLLLIALAEEPEIRALTQPIFELTRARDEAALAAALAAHPALGEESAAEAYRRLAAADAANFDYWNSRAPRLAQLRDALADPLVQARLAVAQFPQRPSLDTLNAAITTLQPALQGSINTPLE